MQLTLNTLDETAAALESRGVRISAFIQSALQKEAGIPVEHRD